MQQSVCPKCLQHGRHLAASSQNARVDYYRCDRCGHVWSIDKKGKFKDVSIQVNKTYKTG
jgi:uncharacterized Zn finger protein